MGYGPRTAGHGEGRESAETARLMGGQARGKSI